VVTRPTEYELILERHATRGQAAFFLAARGQSLAALEDRQARLTDALAAVLAAIPTSWRRTRVTRKDLDRFVFEPDDVVVAVGQDGLIANVAKYLSGQRVIGVNPDPEQYDGVLVRHSPARAKRLIALAGAGNVDVEERTMVEARLDDGQTLLALNEIFVGHRSHQSARYRIRWDGEEERQSSSGLIVATGTGATGWARSICRERGDRLPLPAPADGRLAFLVREAFPSVATGTTLNEGVFALGQSLTLVSEMNDGGVAFGDGVEEDRLDFHWGRVLTLAAAKTRLRLVRG
jgi:hypothetical protein